MKVISRLLNIDAKNANDRVYSDRAIDTMCGRVLPVLKLKKKFDENFNDLSKIGTVLGVASARREGNDLVITAEVRRFPKNCSLNIAGVIIEGEYSEGQESVAEFELKFFNISDSSSYVNKIEVYSRAGKLVRQHVVYKNECEYEK